MGRQPPTFDQFTQFVREFSGYPDKELIGPDSQFERDLGITGDDGDDLLIATEKKFQVAFVTEDRSLRETFHMAPNEFLFHGEGFGCNPLTFFWPFDDSEPEIIRAFTVGELYEVVCKLVRVTPDYEAN